MTLNPIVSVEWLYENLDIPNLVILDASVKDTKIKLVSEFPDIQIKGAIHFSMETTFYDKDSSISNMIPSADVFAKECRNIGIDKNSIIVVYDNIGIFTSPRAWWMFKSMGHQHIAVLDGGLPAWKNADLPCEPKKETLQKKGDFEANYYQELIRDSSFILNEMSNKDNLIIDARSKSRFTGEAPEPRENMASGHIPNSVNLPFNLVLDHGKMKSKAELIKIFDDLNTDGKQLIFTCGSGVTACIILLASELVLLNNKSMFDGSWSEWGQLNKFPVEQ